MHVSLGPSRLFFIRQRLCESGKRQPCRPVLVSLLGWPACCCFSSRFQCFKNRPLTGGPAWACLLILSVCLKWGVVSIRKPFYPQIWTICFSINLTGKSICIPFYSFSVSHLGLRLDRGRNEFFLGLPRQSFQILILNLFEYPYTEWS